MISRFLKNHKGQSMVETAVAILMFMGLLLITADVAHVCFNWVCLQHRFFYCLL